ncbi:MAG: glycosyltransferase family 39 protein [Candidatus Micrarchaeota archaeon]
MTGTSKSTSTSANNFTFVERGSDAVTYSGDVYYGTEDLQARKTFYGGNAEFGSFDGVLVENWTLSAAETDALRQFRGKIVFLGQPPAFTGENVVALSSADGQRLTQEFNALWFIHPIANWQFFYAATLAVLLLAALFYADGIRGFLRSLRKIERNEALIVAGIMLLAVLIRAAPYPPFLTGDESVISAYLQSLAGATQPITAQNSHVDLFLFPLYYPFYWLLGGDASAALRACNLFFSLASILAAYVFARSAFGKKAAAFSALVIAVAPWHWVLSKFPIYRGGMALTFGFLAMHFTRRSLEDDSNLYAAAIFASFAALSYPLLKTLPLALAAYAVLAALFLRPKLRVSARLFAALALFAVLMLPSQAVISTHPEFRSYGYYASKSAVLTDVYMAYSSAGIGALGPALLAAPAQMLGSAAYMAQLLFLPAPAVPLMSSDVLGTPLLDWVSVLLVLPAIAFALLRMERGKLLLLSMVFLAGFLPLLLFRPANIFGYFFMMFLMPLSIVVGWFCSEIWERGRFRLPLAALFAIAAASTLFVYLAGVSMNPATSCAPQAGRMADFIRAENPDVVVASSFNMRAVLLYTLDGDRTILLPRGAKVLQYYLPEQDFLDFDVMDASALHAFIEGKTVVFMEAGDAHALSQTVYALGLPAVTRDFGCGQETFYRVVVVEGATP